MRAGRRLLVLIAGLAGVGHAAAAHAAAEEEATAGESLYQTRCAGCHEDAGAIKAPALAGLRQMNHARVRYALTRGSMQAHAAGLDREQVGELVAYVTGRGDGPYQVPAQARCAEVSVDLDPVYVGGWGFDDANTAFRGPPHTALNGANVSSLRLKWAFGVPDTSDMRSQPVITADTVFLSTVSGMLFALDRETGCVKWTYHSTTPLRTSLHLGTSRERPALFFGDFSAAVSAVDAVTGELLWREPVGLFEWSTTTGSPVQHGERLFVPISSYEVGVARRDDHPCCRSHGAVRALNPDTGAVLWTTHTTKDAVPTYVSSAGTQQWGPSGATVWSTPAVDEQRGVIYVGTGQNSSSPATATSDAILALDMGTGAIRWIYQATAGDAYNDACTEWPNGANCPPEVGPDHDFGASVIIARNREGRGVLLAGQKSGEVHALDPDDQGRLLWRRRLSQGSWLGGVHWGMAVEGDRVLVPVADPEYGIDGYEPRPGLYALRIEDGSVLWEQRIQRGCETTAEAYYQRIDPWPACSWFYGYSAAAAAVPGAALVAGLDGSVNAYATGDGRPLWRFDTARVFDTVNGVEGHGGSIDSAGVQPAADMLFVQSGYSWFSQMPGNVLLAFQLGEAIQPE